jgi:hypothetical protein
MIGGMRDRGRRRNDGKTGGGGGDASKNRCVRDQVPCRGREERIRRGHAHGCRDWGPRGRRIRNSNGAALAVKLPGTDFDAAATVADESREDLIVGQAVEMMALSERLLWPYRALTVN